MNSIEEKICSAIDIIVQRAISQASYDRTIQATVVNCIDATIGKYSVKYQDSTFYAYSGSSDVTYSSGASVYVLVPGNDMSKDKTILGTTQKLGINYISTIEKDEAYEIIGNNCVSSENIFELSSYYKDRRVIVLYHKNNAEAANKISLDKVAVEQYIKNSNTIICGATVKTKLPVEQQYRGDYGVIFALNFTDNASNEVITRYYIVDVDQMTGNPYKMLYDTRQYGIFDIDGANFKEVEYICIFCDNFPNSKPDNECVSDIFIKNVELCGAERLSEEDINNYTITFVTPKGTYFDGSSLDSDTKIIQAQVRVKGKVVDNNSQKLPFYWFVEHVGVTSQSQFYNKYGGQGWKCLNDYNVVQEGNTEEPAVVEWNSAPAELIVKKTEVTAKEVLYKCVVVYDGVVISKTITLKNLSSNYDIKIISDSGTKFYFDNGFPTLTCLVNGEENNKYSYSWAVTNNVGYFETLPETPDLNNDFNNKYTAYTDLLNKIENESILYEPNKATLENLKLQVDEYDKITRVNKNKVYKLNVGTITNFSSYSCTVYYNDLYLGTASIILSNSLEPEGSYSLVINNSSYTYKYNENGISPANGAMENPIEIPILTFTIYDNLGDPVDEELANRSNIKWIVPYEDTLIKIPEEYTPIETDENNKTKTYSNLYSFSYKIEDRYDINKRNNDIKLLVDYKGISLSATTDLTFVKEGQSGTNGTEFTCKIVPNVPSGEEPPKHPVITQLSNGKWSINYTSREANKFFRVQLWHNEVKILDSNVSALTSENKEAKVSWSVLKNKYNAGISDPTSLTINESDGTVDFSGYRSDSPANIIKATVIYDDVVYYATISVLTVKLINNDYRVTLKDSTGFTHALYSSDGQRPKYSTIPFELVVIKNINGYQVDVSSKGVNEAVDYKWNYQGKIYENKTWVDNINLVDKTGEVLRNQKAVKPLDSFDGQCVTNALESIISKSGAEVARIHIPIHLLLNRYGNSAISDWDGNSINIDSDGGFILSPQVGAGIKESDNSFTGIFMGKVKETDQTQEDIGLIGYYKGQRSLFLDSKTGRAQFGVLGKSQIIIDPSSDKAQLYSGNYSIENKTGMMIDLTTPEIRYGSGNFYVNKDGHFTAKGGGSIAGWIMTDTELYSPAPYNNRAITLDSFNKKIYSNRKTKHDSNAEGFYLDKDYLVLGSKFKAYADGKLEIGTGAYNSGYSKRWIIDGDSDNSYIRYGTKGNTGSVYIGTSDIQLGKGFSVDANGLLKVGNLTGRYWLIAGKTNDASGNAFMSYNHTVTYDENGVLATYPTINSTHPAKSVYLGVDGLAIGSRFIIKADQSSSKIAYGTDALDPPNGYGNNQFYLGIDGFRVGSKFKIDNTGKLYIGYLSSARHFIFDGNATNSYLLFGTKATFESMYFGTDGLYIGSRIYFRSNDTGFRIAYGTDSLTPSAGYGNNQIYLSTDGLRIGTKFKVNNTGKVEIGTLSMNRHFIFDSNANDTYLIWGTKATINSMYYGTDGIYVGSKFYVKSDDTGFKLCYNTDAMRPVSGYGDNQIYFGIDGLRIGSKFKITPTGKLEIGNLNKGNILNIDADDNDVRILFGNSSGVPNTVSFGQHGLIIGSQHWIASNDKGFQLGYNVNTQGDPFNQYGNNQVYIGTSGIRLGTKFKVDNNGVAQLGNINGNHWTVNSGTNNSFISFGGGTSFVAATTATSTAKVYLGTDGISLGNNFSVSALGQIKAFSGTIGGFDITSTGLKRDVGNYTVEFNNPASAHTINIGLPKNIHWYYTSNPPSNPSYLSYIYKANQRAFSVTNAGEVNSEFLSGMTLTAIDRSGSSNGSILLYGKLKNIDSLSDLDTVAGEALRIPTGLAGDYGIMRTKALIWARENGLAFQVTNGSINFYESSGSTFVNDTKCNFYLDVKIWKNIYNSAGAAITSSDKKLKNSIEPLDLSVSSKFIYSLTPYKYKYNSGTSGRYHHGFIADEVKDCMEEDWGLYIENKISKNETEKGLRYEELIADLIATVQEQNKRILALELRRKGE